MNALTRKVKLISDLMDRVPNLVSNSDLLIDNNNDIPDGFSYANATDISLTNGEVYTRMSICHFLFFNKPTTMVRYW